MRKLFVLLVAAVLVGGCQTQPAEPPPVEFVYGLTLEPSGIDPHIHASAELGIPLRSVYDTLVYYDQETDTYVPGLAESWEVTNGGLDVTFTLRQDVTFHDGTAFDAEAVRINIERILDPANNSAKAADLLGPVTEVQVIDPYTVLLKLSLPFPALFDGLSQPYLGMASPAALAENDAATYQFNQVGTGPYRFVEYIVGDRLILERNPDYAWAPSVISSDPQTERIVFRFFSDPSSRSLALQSGEVDVVGEVLPNDARQLQSNGDAQLQQVEIPGQPQQMFFNTQRFPTNDPVVREALLLAADRQAIAQTVFQGYRPVAFGPLSSATRNYDPAVQALYPHDAQQALTVLNSTGLIDQDGDGVRETEEGQPLVIDVVVPPWGLTPDVAVLLEQQWESTLNIQVNLVEVPSFPVLIDAASSGEYNLISLNFFGYDPIVLNEFYRSDGRLNWTGYANEEMDNLLFAAQHEVDEQARAELYAKIQQRIMDEALVLPLTEYVNVVGYSAAVQGLRFDAQGWYPYLADVSVNP